MAELKNQFTHQEYTDYKCANYKHYDDRKIQELHEFLLKECDVWFTHTNEDRYLKRMLNIIEKAEIPYENRCKYKDQSSCEVPSHEHIVKPGHFSLEWNDCPKKKRWWQR